MSQPKPTRSRLCAVAAVAILTVLGAGRDARAITQCTFGSIVGVAFGGYDPLSSTPLDSTGSITYSCSGVQTGDSITLDLGKGTAASYTPRQMTSGGALLEYNLYLDAARTAIWGDASGGSGHYGPVAPGDGVNETVSVYGRVFARQNVPAGAYGDDIVVTINF